MSLTVEYYFHTPLSTPEVAAQLNRTLSCDLTPFNGDETDYLTRLVGTEFYLQPNEDENDGELEFEAYNHMVMLRTSGTAGYSRPIQLPVLMSAVRLMQYHLGYAGMLVFNLQILLAKYAQDTFVDTLSGTTLDDFPAHFAAVVSRLPEGHGLTVAPRTRVT